MSKKIKKNYALRAASNQLTVENIKNINDTISTEAALRKNENTSLSVQIANAISELLSLKNETTQLQENVNSVNFFKEKFILTASNISNGYVDLANKAKVNSMRIEMEGYFVLQENVDYLTSIVNNKTRITFIDNGLQPFFEENDVLFIQYYYSN